ncbi:hypothetical protein MtrunA17_Chr7g0244051 [Medicago truncatula]|uniref:Uncharacterized protein n=1 Tax=Medicago truncatula TaxID=3880 RepID=A0A396H1H8_MEDTR|nr:hypothetical protein MtrunA17_Chr7g0244051 [Medicago truncatula]
MDTPPIKVPTYISSCRGLLMNARNCFVQFFYVSLDIATLFVLKCGAWTYCVKSLTSVRSWPDNLFISGGNLHLTSRFCGVMLGSTTISNMVSESLHDSLGHLLSGFRYQVTHHLCSRFRCVILTGQFLFFHACQASYDASFFMSW